MKLCSIIEFLRIFWSESLQHDRNVGEPNGGLTRSVGAFVVFAQTSIASHPRKGSLHDPTTRNHRESRWCVLWSRHDFDSPSRSMALKPIIQFIIMILRIRPNQLHATILLLRNFLQDKRCRIPSPLLHIGNSGRLNHPKDAEFGFRCQFRPKSDDRFECLPVIGRKSGIFEECYRFCSE